MFDLVMEGVGWLAAILTVLTYAVRTMVPLRILAIVSGLAFIAYGLANQLWPMLFMEFLLLPLNVWRLWQLMSLRRRVEALYDRPEDDFSALRNAGRARDVPQGEAIFNRGDKADKLYYLAEGSVRIEEVDVTLEAGDIFGEIAFFTDAETRTATVRALTPARIRELDRTDFLRMHFQDPVFGMAIMRTVTRRLTEGMARVPGNYADLAARPGAS